jgi:hypothetical protein
LREEAAVVIPYQSLRASTHVQVILATPILDWQGISGRFFRMIYDTLKGKLNITPGDFSLSDGRVLNEIRAKYSLFSGPTSISLYADRLAFDFPNLAPMDYPIATDVVASVHDAFPRSFSEMTYNRVDVQSYEHLDLSSEEAVARFLERFKMSGVESFFDFPVVQVPTFRLAVEAQDGSWQCGLLNLERSLFSSEALFVAATVSMRNATPTTSFLEKQAHVTMLIRSLCSAVGLEGLHVER